MTNHEHFPEQEAPQKNTDRAFVQVGKDGQPTVPHTTAEASEQANEDGHRNDRTSPIQSPPKK